MSATTADTIPVEYRLLGLERIAGAGRLLALANVEVDVAGVVLRLQGFQVHRRPDGRIECVPPVWRHPGLGKWLPAVLMPNELASAIAAEILAAGGSWGALPPARLPMLPAASGGADETHGLLRT